MKNSFLLVLTLLSTTILISQTEVPDGIAAPSSVSNKFSTDYPDASPSWESDGSNYRAQYNDKVTKKNRALVYDGNGNIIRTDSEMEKNTLPAGVSNYYNTNYPGDDSQVFVTEDNMGNRQYYIKRKTGMVWFDKNGKYVSGNSEKTIKKETIIINEKEPVKKTRKK